jgi:hypothetical protein
MSTIDQFGDGNVNDPLSEVDFSIGRALDFCNQLKSKIRQTLDAHYNVSAADLNLLAMRPINSADSAILAANSVIDDFRKKIGTELDQQQFQAAVAVRPFLEMVADQQTITDAGGQMLNGTGETFCIWFHESGCECRMVQGTIPPEPIIGWELIACFDNRTDAEAGLLACIENRESLCKGNGEIPPPPEPKPEPTPEPEPTRWDCAGARCFPKTNGRFATLAECVRNCDQPPQPRWACVGGTCLPSATGPYSSEDDCLLHCKKESRWGCNTVTGQCFPQTNGPYPSLTSCMQACRKAQCKCVNVSCPPPVTIVQPPNVDVDVTVEAEEKDEPCFIVWQERDSKVCVVTRCDEPPPEGNWIAKGEVNTLQSAASIVNSICQPPDVRPEFEPELEASFIPDTTNPAECANLGAIIQAIKVSSQFPLAQLFGLKDKDGKDTDIGGLLDLKLFGLQLGNIIEDVVRTVLVNLDEGSRSLVHTALVGDTAKISQILTQGIINVANFVLGSGAFPIKQRAEHVTNFLMPSNVPSVDAGTESFLRNSMDKTELDCLVRLNGHNPAWWNKIVDGRRAKLSPLELTALWRRNLITTADHSAEIRGLGYIDATSPAYFRELSRQIPFVTDLIRMMVRDAADVALVKRFGMDDGFEDKFAGQLKEWAEMQGVEEEHMKFIWRAHWSIPSPGQLFEMWQRQRKKGDTFDNSQLGKDVHDALVQQDILPFWIPRLEKISFRPLTRRDLRRAYERGALTDQQLEKGLMEQGSSDANVQILLGFFKVLREDYLTNRPASRAYRDGGFTRKQAFNALKKPSIADTEINAALDRAKQQRQGLIARECIRGIERQFLLGEMTEGEARDALINLGHDASDADDFIVGFRCKRLSRGKTLPTSQLCGFVEDGIITSDQFFDRLVAVGHNAADAAGVVKRCNLKISRSRRRKELATKKEVARLARKAETNRKGRVRAQDRRLKQIEQAAKLIQKGEGMILTDAFARVSQTFTALQVNFGATMDEAARCVVLAAEQTVREPEILFEIAAATILQQRRSVATPPLQTTREVAGEIEPLKLIQCQQCFHMIQQSDFEGTLEDGCPVCSGPLNVIEISRDLGGNGQTRIT